MTKIDIQNPKLIVTNVKHEFLLVKLKVRKNGIFWVKNQIIKIFPWLILFPNPSYVNNLVL